MQTNGGCFSVSETLGKSAKAQPPTPIRHEKRSWETGSRPLLSDFLDVFCDIAMADRWGKITGSCKLRGTTVPMTDGILAAAALHYDLTLVTRNVREVQSTGVDTLDPCNL